MTFYFGGGYKSDGPDPGTAFVDGYKKSKLGRLLGDAYSAPQDQRRGLLGQIAQLDPDAASTVDERFSKMDERAAKQLQEYARLTHAAWKSGNKPMAEGIYGRALQLAKEVYPGFEAGPLDDATAEMFGQLGGANAEQEEYTLTPGAARYRGGRMIASQPMQPGRPIWDSERGVFIQPPDQPAYNPPGMGAGGGTQVMQDAYRNAIASIESAGSGDYAALGPQDARGDRPYGRYQVMGANIPEWTQAALGRPMTPEEFVASPEAQDAVFDHRFGGYVQKYGPEGAAKAWFAGEGGMNNPNARDSLGTSVAQYGQRFQQNMGPRAIPVEGIGPKRKEQAVTLGAEEVRSLGLPAGTVAQRRPDGTISVVSKPEGGMTPAQRQKIEQNKRKENMSRVAFDAEASERLALIDEILAARGDLVGVVGNGRALSKTPISNKYTNLRAKVDRLRTLGAFGTLAAMRAASPTGGALGAVSDRENTMLENAAATLQDVQTPDAFVKALLKYKTSINQSRQRIHTSFADHYGQGAQQPARQAPAPSSGGWSIKVKP